MGEKRKTRSDNDVQTSKLHGKGRQTKLGTTNGGSKETYDRTHK